MDILKYLNSRDIAEFLESIHFEFNAMQAAYVVYINDWLTIEERIKLWREITETMPDCEYQSLSNYSIYIKPSAHVAILDHIEKVQSDLQAFLENNHEDDECVYVPISSRWGRCPEWISSESKEGQSVGGAVWNKCIRAMPFTSFEKCIQYLKNESDLCERSDSWGKYEPFDRYRIGKTTLNGEWGDCYAMYAGPEPNNFFIERMTLNGDFEPISVSMGWPGNEFDHFVPEIPHPFSAGDILLDVSRAPSLPFVFDRGVTWSLEDKEKAIERQEKMNQSLKKKGIEPNHALYRFVYTKECNSALIDRCRTGGVLYFSHGQMFAYGYEIALREEEILEYNWSGACDNILNLEYYRGLFEGKLAILPAVSWFVMNEVRPPSSNLLGHVHWEERAYERFNARGIDTPDAAAYDICALVNAAYKLG